jgi:hypothetical protein
MAAGAGAARAGRRYAPTTAGADAVAGAAAAGANFLRAKEGHVRQHALRIVSELGDRFAESAILVHLGDAYRDAQQAQQARDAWRQALRILDELGHPSATAVRAKIYALAGAENPRRSPVRLRSGSTWELARSALVSQRRNGPHSCHHRAKPVRG